MSCQYIVRFLKLVSSMFDTYAVQHDRQ